MKAKLTKVINDNLQPLSGKKSDFDGLLKITKEARFVLIGEATHGTQEFYKIRADLTKKLIEEQGFNAVAIEGDWPDAYHINRYVNHTNSNGNSTHALSHFDRFPRWMWQNKEVSSFIKWLHGYNVANSAQIGFYGLDLYGTNNSISAVISYLDKIDAEAGRRARVFLHR